MSRVKGVPVRQCFTQLNKDYIFVYRLHFGVDPVQFLTG